MTGRGDTEGPEGPEDARRVDWADVEGGDWADLDDSGDWADPEVGDWADLEGDARAAAGQAVGRPGDGAGAPGEDDAVEGSEGDPFDDGGGEGEDPHQGVVTIGRFHEYEDVQRPTAGGRRTGPPEGTVAGPADGAGGDLAGAGAALPGGAGPGGGGGERPRPVEGPAPDVHSGGPAGGLGRATAVMAVGTGLSRLTGVLRIFALAYALGALGLGDAYNLANTLPNIIHDVVLGGVLSATFVPVFVERLTTRTDDDAWDAISAVVSVTMIVIAVASVLFLVLAAPLVGATTALNHAAGVAQERRVATELLWLFVPQLTCYGFISLGTALLNARRRFGAPMFTPIANNVVLIVVLVVFGTTVHHASVAGVDHDRGQLLLLGLGTTAGVVIQAVLMIPSLRRAGLRLHWNPDFRHETVRRILRLSGWTFGLVVANQVALVVVLALSQKVGTGAVSAYTYAYTFFQLPYGVVAVSIMSATAPELAARWAVGDLVAFRRRMGTGLRAMLAIIIPAAAGEVILSKPLVALVLSHGAAAGGTEQTAVALAMLALGLPGFCVFLYAVRVLQSVQDLRSAFWLYALENGVNIVLAVALAGRFGVRGIALSITLAYTIAAVAALGYVRARVQGLGGEIVGRPLGHVLLATCALVLAAVLGSNVSASQTTAGLLGRVVLGAGAGALAYVLAAGGLAQRGRPGRGAPAGPEEGAGPRGGPAPPAGQGDGPGRPRGRRGPVSGQPLTGPTGWRPAADRPRRRRSRPGAPPPPTPLPPAGRPPLRPTRLGPTRSPDRDE
jgi:putative peptidoglycan lipid II flippase